MNTDSRSQFRSCLVVLELLIIICVIAQLSSNSSFNRKVYVQEGNVQGEYGSADVHFRGDSTSSWLKRELAIYGNIFDTDIKNTSPYKMIDWSVTYYVQGDCYLNQFWNGTVEIHQAADTPMEKVQTLNLASYTLSDLQLDYIVDGSDLLIPLTVGDYFIYYPNVDLHEAPLEPNSETSVGMILYYAGDLNVEKYEFHYQLHKRFTDGFWFLSLVILFVVWLVAFISYLATYFAYRRATNEMELRKSGISCMSEIYSIIYIVDLENNTVTPVNVPEEYEKRRPKDWGADEQFRNLFETDAQPGYKDMMVDFGRTATLPIRMERRNTLSAEYESKTWGWTRIRWIAMDRKEGQPVDKVLFTIENINQEKRELSDTLGQMEKARSENRVKSAFLANMTQELRDPLVEMLDENRQNLEAATDEGVRERSEKMRSSGEKVLFLVDNMLDFARIESGDLTLLPRNYSLKEMLADVEKSVTPVFRERGAELKCEVSDVVPDGLFGDDVRLKQILTNILINSTKFTKSDSVRLAIFGKIVNPDTIHLLVSVKDNGDLIPPEAVEALEQKYDGPENEANRIFQMADVSMSLVSGLLGLMNSSMRIATMPGQGNDLYFEINQGITNPVEMQQE